MTGWRSSDRRSRLPEDWAMRRNYVRRRANDRCENPGCTHLGSECDHIDRGDDHSLGNLQWLCYWCHKDKTLAEVREVNSTRVRQRRQEEAHPGLRNA